MPTVEAPLTFSGGLKMASAGPGLRVAAKAFSKPWPGAKLLFQTF